MKVIVKSPWEHLGHYEEISDELDSLQRKVGGYVRAVQFRDDAVILCDDDGIPRGAEKNFLVEFLPGKRQWIRGMVVICGVSLEEDGEKFTDVPINLGTWEIYLAMWGNGEEAFE